jgi:nucleolar pre-ribosomal-associated protein 1
VVPLHNIFQVEVQANMSKDMEIYRSRNVFERILALYNPELVSESVQVNILKLCFRAINVEGSTTLATRSGISSWIQAHSALSTHNEVYLKRLAESLQKSCDQRRVMDWSKGAIFK